MLVRGGKAERRHKDRRRYTFPRGSACISSKHRVRHTAAACVLIRFNADRYLAARGGGRRWFPTSRLFRPLPLPSFFLFSPFSLSLSFSLLFLFISRTAWCRLCECYASRSRAQCFTMDPPRERDWAKEKNERIRVWERERERERERKESELKNFRAWTKWFRMNESRFLILWFLSLFLVLVPACVT